MTKISTINELAELHIIFDELEPFATDFSQDDVFHAAANLFAIAKGSISKKKTQGIYSQPYSRQHDTVTRFNRNMRKGVALDRGLFRTTEEITENEFSAFAKVSKLLEWHDV